VPRTLPASADDARRMGATRVVELLPLLGDLPARFARAGHALALVGGPVRDALMGHLGDDLDLTTDARPEQIEALMSGWADAIWDVGAAFGTIGGQRNGTKVEITTYRADVYQDASRKPDVQFGDSLEGDLHRRDFTVNSMAVLLPSLSFVDPFDGIGDLVRGVLRTPGKATESFADDPLRMMRAARFASQLGFTVDDEAIAAMTSMAERISIVSAERVRDEIIKLVLGDHPRKGLELLVTTGIAQIVLPELPKLALEIDEHHKHKDVYEHTLTVLEQAIDLETTHEPVSGPDFVLRFAALMHDIGKPRTRRFEDGGGVSFHHHEVVGAKMTTKRMRELRFSNEEIDKVSRLVELHLRFHGYGTGEWTDSAVRRYVRDAGELLTRLHKLTRADSTTRNRRKAQALANSYDDLEQRIAVLAQQEELAAIRPVLDGNRIMEVLGIGPGRDVGRAYAFLLEHRLDNGPIEQDQAEEILRQWWISQQS
jgi:poly(A) polymerase